MKLRDIDDLGIFPFDLCRHCENKLTSAKVEPCLSCELAGFKPAKRGEKK